MSLRATALLSILLAASAALADDTHYQDQIVGEDALGMGGAFTAVADDASAAFYNPAGLAQIRGGSLSGSLSVYGYERRSLENGLQSSVGNPEDCRDVASPPPDQICTRNLVHEDYPTRGIGGGVVKRFGKRGPDRQRPFAFAFSTYIPFQSSLRWQVAYKVDHPYGEADPVEYSDRRITIVEEDKTVWVGPSLAYRFSADLAIGLSAFLSTRTLARNYDESQVDAIGNPDPYAPEGAVIPDYANIITTSMDANALTAVLRLGVLWTPGDRVRLGLMLAPPSIPIDGDGSVSNRSLVSNPDSYDRSSFDNLEVNAALPAHGRLGFAYVFSEAALVAADLSLWLPLSYTDESPFIEGAAVFTDNYFVRIYDRQLTPNLNVGFETMLGATVPFRVGAFTNLSSAPPPHSGVVPMQPDVDMFGGSFAVGYRDEGYDISIGAAAMYGIGQALAYRQGDVSIDEPYSLERYEQTAVYLYLAGAKKAAGRAVREFMKP